MKVDSTPLKSLSESIAKTVDAIEKFSVVKAHNEELLRVYQSVNLETDCARMKRTIKNCESNINRLFRNLDNLNNRMTSLLN